MSDKQKQFTVTIASLTVLGVFAMVAFVALAYVVPAHTLALGGVVGVLAAVLAKPILDLYRGLNDVKEIIQQGQVAAKGRNETVVEELREVKEMAKVSEGMPQTLDQLRGIIREELAIAAPTIVRETLNQLRGSGELVSAGGGTWSPKSS